MEKNRYKKGILDRDYQDMDRKYLKGTEVEYHRSKDYEDNDGCYPESNTLKWTGQFRTHYKCKDENGLDGGFTIFYQDLFIKK